MVISRMMPDRGFDHWRTLLKVADRTTGPIAEFGIGYGSTPLLHLLCIETHRRLWSFETEAGWYSAFQPLNTWWHRVMKVDSYASVVLATDSMLFLDHGPTELCRLDTLERNRDRMTVAVIHDMGEDGMRDALADMKFKYVAEENITAVVSDCVDVAALLR